MSRAGERIQAHWGKGAFLICLCLCLIWCAGAAASALPAAGAVRGAEEGDVIPGHYIVVLKDSVARPGVVANRQTENEGGDLNLVYRHALKGYSAELSKEAVAELRQNPLVDYIAPDRVAEVAAQTMPAGVSRIFATENTSLKIDGKENVEVDADIAIIDSGVDYEHPDLNVVMRTNCVPAGENVFSESSYSECKDGTGTDLNGHGTHVAGTAAALDNGEGVVGVAPGARLWAVRTMNREGSGSESWIVAAVDWVTARANQIEVANMSLGCSCPMPALEEAIEASAAAGVVYSIAAGNDHEDVENASPAKNPDVIAVTAITVSDPNTDLLKPSSCSAGPVNQLAYFSNFGTDVDVAAPGTCIYSTLPNEEYGYLQGTSMASPHVAGAAAILASAKNPEDLEDVESIREAIEEAGNFGWTDTSGDSFKEALLDIHSSTIFAAKGPTAITQPALITSASKATLRGAVNPGGVSTEYRFEYGTSTSYGTSVPVPAKAIGSGSSYVAAEVPLEGLSGGTLYHYRVVAINSKGTSYGADRTFGTTPATTSIETPTVHANDATLRASINPQGLETTYYFQYGTTTKYGHKAPLSPKSVGSGTSAVTVNEAVGLLTGDKTYHYRLVVRSAAGTVYGGDQTLKTTPSDWARQTLPTLGQGRLRDVSCASQSSCMAVGESAGNISGVSPPTAASWNGKEWSELTVPNPAAKGDLAYLTGVSCVAADWCVAVGPWINTEVNLFVEQWDGAKWTTASIPSMRVGNSAYPPKVSCVSKDFCMAAVSVTTPAGDARGGSLLWNGQEWSAQPPMPEPAGTAWSSIGPVSCTSSSSCVAVGRYMTATGKFSEVVGPLAVRWDGHDWSIIQDDYLGSGKGMAAGLYGVSCAAADSCTALLSGGMWAQRWNGEKWSLESVPEPVSTQSNTERVANPGISCSTKTSCSAVGYYWADERSYDLWGYSMGPRAASWNGSEWLSRSAANPGQEQEPNSAERIYLEGVSCVSPSSCVAVGAGGPFAPLAERYQAPGPISETKPATSVGLEAATLNAVVNPRSSSTSYYFEYGKTTAYGTKIPVSPKAIGSGSVDVSVSQAVTGLVPGTSYHYRVVATNSAGTTYGEDKIATTDRLPKATTEGATPVKSTEAVLRGVVNPEGNATNYYFEYGKTTSYGTKIPTSPTAVGSGNGDVSVSQTITGLTTGTTYNFRVVAEKAGVKVYGANKVVIPGSTAPFATTEPAVLVKATSASMIGLVNPAGTMTYFYFEYGKTTSYGTKVSIVPKEVGSGTGNLGVEEALTGLTPNTTYNYRVIAENAGGKTIGLNRTFTTTKLLKATTDAATGITQGSITLNGTVNPEGLATSYYFQYGVTSAYEYKIPFSAKEIGSGSENVSVSQTISSLAAGRTWHYRVVASNAGATVYGEDRTATTKFEPPGATTGSATSVKATSATLPGVVNPRGTAASYYFEYGKTTAYGTKIPITAKEAGSGTSNVSVSEAVTGLVADTTYHFRIVAESSGGTTNGADKSFTTLKVPKVTTEAASSVKGAEASLNATVNPEGSAASYYFEYGKTVAFGTKAPVSPKSAGSGTSNVAVQETVTGLQAGNTYFYRVVAEGAGVVVNGSVMTLTTPGPPKAETQPAAGLKTTGATIKGTVNPNAFATTYYFEYGSTASYGSKAPAVAKEAGSGTSDVNVSATVGGLSEDAVYHYRVVAVSSAGTTKGEDKTLQTRELPTEPAAFWSLGGEELEAGKANAVDFYAYGELNFQFVGIQSGPCEVELEGSVWNGSGTGEGSIEPPTLAGTCKTSTGCTITGLTPSAEGSWPLTATQGEVHIGGNLEFTLNYSGGCGLPPTIPLGGLLGGDFDNGVGCIELSKAAGLDILPSGAPVTVDGELCPEAEGGLFTLD